VLGGFLPHPCLEDGLPHPFQGCGLLHPFLWGGLPHPFLQGGLPCPFLWAGLSHPLVNRGGVFSYSLFLWWVGVEVGGGRGRRSWGVLPKVLLLVHEYHIVSSLIYNKNNITFKHGKHTQTCNSLFLRNRLKMSLVSWRYAYIKSSSQ